MCSDHTQIDLGHGCVIYTPCGETRLAIASQWKDASGMRKDVSMCVEK